MTQDVEVPPLVDPEPTPAFRALDGTLHATPKEARVQNLVKASRVQIDGDWLSQMYVSEALYSDDLRSALIAILREHGFVK